MTTDPESVACDECLATAGVPCVWTQTITEDGVTRRAVHATRKAASLPQEERAAFWAHLIDEVLPKQLARMAAKGSKR